MKFAPLTDDEIEAELVALGGAMSLGRGVVRVAVTTSAPRKMQLLEEVQALRAALGIRRTSPPPARVDCPRCSECVGLAHHWLEATDVRRVGYTCKHCEAWCAAVDDDEGGGCKPSGVTVAITPELRAARDEVIDLIEKHANALPAAAAQWLIEEVNIDAEHKLDAILDGEIDFDFDDEDREPELDSRDAMVVDWIAKHPGRHEDDPEMPLNVLGRLAALGERGVITYSHSGGWVVSP